MSDFGVAWLTMSVALGLHVADEAAHNFLAWYNPTALRIRARLGGLPFPPVFTFWPWLAGLIVLTVVLLLLTPYADDGRPWMRPVAVFLGVINAGNGLLHLTATAVLRRRVPGVMSSPLLLASAGLLLWTALR